MPQQKALEGIEWKQTFRVPSVDMAQSERTVQPPFLLEAAGIDGRIKGTLRSFPGFRGLGIAEAYGGQGPLIVGPGIFHDYPGLVDGTPCWWHWPFRLPRLNTEPSTAQVRFFKALAFKKSATSSEMVTGFVVCLPYEGVTRDELISLYGAGKDAYGTGLPHANTKHKYIVAFLYWDDASFYAGATKSKGVDPKGPGWRIRILNMPTWYAGVNEPYNPAGIVTYADAQGSVNFDCGAYGRFGYMVGPDVSDVGKSFWGAPADLDATLAKDGGIGPQVLYYYEPSQCVIMRPLGNSNIPFCYQHTPKSETTPRADAGNGMIEITGAGPGCEVQITLLDSATGRRIGLEDHGATYINTGSALIGQMTYIHTRFYITLPMWDQGFDTVEFWRSPVGLPGLLFKEFSCSLPAAGVYNAALDGPDSTYRRYYAVWGSSAINAAQCDGMPAGIAREDFIAGLGLYDVSLTMQEPYGGYFMFNQAPPADSSRILTYQQMSMVAAGKGTDYEDAGFAALNRPARAVVPTKVRWTSPMLPRPEDFSDLAAQWTPDEDVGMLYGLGRAGNFMFAVGTRGTVAFRRAGDRMVVSTVGDDIAPVSRFAWCVGGDNLFVLTKSGLMLISGADTSVMPVEIVTRLLNDVCAWGSELAYDVEAPYPAIGLQYDEAGKCLFIRNLNRLECAVLWIETGALTWLHDFAWQWSTAGAIPASEQNGATQYAAGGANRAFFVAELDKGLPQEAADTHPAYLDVFYADFARDTAPIADAGYARCGTYTMHGSATRLSGSFEKAQLWDGGILRGTIASISDDAGSGTSRIYVSMGIAQQGGSTLVDLLCKRFSGAIVHLWSADRLTHLRRSLFWFDEGDATHARYWLYPVLSAGEKTALAGGAFALAPIVLRVKTALLPSADGEQTGQRKTVQAASFAMDFVDVRQWVSGAGNAIVYATDASGTLLWAIGEAATEALLATESTYGPLSVARNGVLSLSTLLAGRAIVPRDRLVASVKNAVTPSRKEQDTAVGLPFSGAGVAAGLEGYLCGALMELGSLRVLGNILPSARSSA